MPELKVKIGGDASAFQQAIDKSVGIARDGSTRISSQVGRSFKLLTAEEVAEQRRRDSVDQATRDNKARRLRRERAEERAARLEAAKPPVIPPPVIPKAKQFASPFAGLGPWMAGMVSIGAVTRIVTAFDDLIDRIVGMSDALNMSVEGFQRLSHAATVSNVKTETFENGLRKLADTVGDAQSGSGDAAAKFEKYGVAIFDAAGNARTMDEILFSVADAMQATAAGSARASMAVDLFGKAGTKMVPMLQGGADALREMGAAASVISAEDARNIDKLSDSWKTLKTSILSEAGAVVGAFAKVSEAIGKLTGKFVSLKDVAAAALQGTPLGKFIAAATFLKLISPTAEPSAPPAAAADTGPMDAAIAAFGEASETPEQKVARLTAKRESIQAEATAMTAGTPGWIAKMAEFYKVSTDLLNAEKAIKIEEPEKFREQRRAEGFSMQPDQATKIGGFIGGMQPGMVADVLGQKQLTAQQQTAKNTAQLVAVMKTRNTRNEWGAR